MPRLIRFAYGLCNKLKDWRSSFNYNLCFMLNWFWLCRQALFSWKRLCFSSSLSIHYVTTFYFCHNFITKLFARVQTISGKSSIFKAALAEVDNTITIVVGNKKKSYILSSFRAIPLYQRLCTCRGHFCSPLLILTMLF